MASKNAFDLLIDVDNDDMTQLIAKLPVPTPAAKPTKPSAAKLPTKPLPPAQAVRETNGQRGGGRSGGRGTGTAGQGGRAFNRDFYDNQYTNGNNNGGYRQPLENEDSEKPDRRAGGGYRPRRGDYFNGDAAEGERPKRVFERHSVIGRGSEFKREGAGRGNWGRIDDVVPEAEEVVADTEKVIDSEKQEETADTNKENTAEVAEQKEPEKEQMTLEEYEKVLEEKRKALVSLKSEERKVALDKDLAKMQLLSSKKSEEDIFVKLGTDKDKKKDAADKEEKAKKINGMTLLFIAVMHAVQYLSLVSVSIEEFLKPADGERYNSGGRGRGRGRGLRGGYTGGNRMNNFNVVAPSIEDVGQFPSLSVKFAIMVKISKRKSLPNLEGNIDWEQLDRFHFGKFEGFWCGKLFGYDFGGFHSNYAFKFGDTRVNKFDAKDKLKPLELMDLVYISKVQDDEVGVGGCVGVIVRNELKMGKLKTGGCRRRISSPIRLKLSTMWKLGIRANVRVSLDQEVYVSHQLCRKAFRSRSTRINLHILQHQSKSPVVSQGVHESVHENQLTHRRRILDECTETGGTKPLPFYRSIRARNANSGSVHLEGTLETSAHLSEVRQRMVAGALARTVYDIGNEVPLNVHGVGIIGNQRSEIVTGVPLRFSECRTSPVGDVSQPACSFPGIFGTTSTSMDNMDVSVVYNYCAISMDHVDCIKCWCLGYVGTPGLLVDGVGAHTMAPSGNRIADTRVSGIRNNLVDCNLPPRASSSVRQSVPSGPPLHPNTFTLKPAIRRELMA
ncbi:hyaluronan/mRNA-binding protein [Tanacetum coccineum]